MIKDLKTLVKYHDGQIASRSLSKTLEVANSITLYAMAKSESISRESSNNTKLIYVLEGNLQLKTDLNDLYFPSILLTFLHNHLQFVEFQNEQ